MRGEKNVRVLCELKITVLYRVFFLVSNFQTIQTIQINGIYYIHKKKKIIIIVSHISKSQYKIITEFEL